MGNFHFHFCQPAIRYKSFSTRFRPMISSCFSFLYLPALSWYFVPFVSPSIWRGINDYYLFSYTRIVFRRPWCGMDERFLFPCSSQISQSILSCFLIPRFKRCRIKLKAFSVLLSGNNSSIIWNLSIRQCLCYHLVSEVLNHTVLAGLSTIGIITWSHFSREWRITPLSMIYNNIAIS